MTLTLDQSTLAHHLLVIEFNRVHLQSALKEVDSAPRR